MKIGGKEHNSIIHQSTYVGDPTEGGGKLKVEGKTVEDKRVFTGMRRELVTAVSIRESKSLFRACLLFSNICSIKWNTKGYFCPSITIF